MSPTRAEIRAKLLANAGQATLTGHTGQVAGLAFSPDGARLATGGSDGTVGAVRVYALRPDDLVKIAQSSVTRSFTTAVCQKYLHVDDCSARYR